MEDININEIIRNASDEELAEMQDHLERFIKATDESLADYEAEIKTAVGVGDDEISQINRKLDELDVSEGKRENLEAAAEAEARNAINEQ